MLKEARRLARGLPPEKREAIEKICTEIEALMKELAELQARGEVRERGEGGMEGKCLCVHVYPPLVCMAFVYEPFGQTKA